MTNPKAASLDPATCTNLNIRRASRQIGQFFDDRMKQAEVSPNQYSLLVFIGKLAPAGISQIASAIGMDRTTLTRNLRILERDGLVEQVLADDARLRLYALTQEGKTVVFNARSQWEACQSEFLGRFGEKRWNALRAELRALQDCLN